MLESLKLQPVDILLTDIMMPVMNGARLAKEVHWLYPSIKTLALSMSGQSDVVNQMIVEADIPAGYVLKKYWQKIIHSRIGKNIKRRHLF